MLDRIDRKILEFLQEDATIPIVDLSEAVGLSQTPCWRRVKKLEESGVIAKRVALLDRKLINVPTTVFLAIKVPRHEKAWLDTFRVIIGQIPEIMEAYRLTGETDYLIRLVLPSVEAYDDIYRQLISRLDFAGMSASISMEVIKYTTAVPLRYAGSR